MLLWVFSPCMSTSSLMDTFYELLTCSTWDITGLNQSYRGTQWNTRLHLCNVSDTVSSLLQTDGQIELQGGLRGKWEENEKRDKSGVWEQRRGEFADWVIIWGLDFGAGIKLSGANVFPHPPGTAQQSHFHGNYTPSPARCLCPLRCRVNST